MLFSGFRKTKDLSNKLSYILTSNQKSIGIMVVLLALVTAVFELLGVSVIVPLVNAIVEPSNIRKSQYYVFFEAKFGYIDDKMMIIGIICGVIIVYVIKNAVFVFNAWIRLKYSNKIQRECSMRMLSSYLNRGYEFFLNNNVNELIQGTIGDISSLYLAVFSILQLITQTAIIVVIAAYMIYVDWLVAVGMVVSAVMCLVIVLIAFRKSVREAGVANRKYSVILNKILLEAFYGIKEILVFNKRKYYIGEFERINLTRQKYQIKQNLGTEIPAYLIEAICIIGIMSVLCIRICGVSDPKSFIATLSTFALGAFRILPSLGKISSSINTITSTIPNINAVYKNMKEADDYLTNNRKHTNEEGNVKCLERGFNSCIELKNITFAYGNEGFGNILESINLKIDKGESIAFIGETGAGKSTLGDIIIGVLNPQQGEVLVDGTNINSIPEQWSDIVAFVPQTIFLSDATIRSNVAFGVSEKDINDELIVDALKKANVWSFVESLPEGINTVIGDRGVRLSGGQRQRLGIARALYRKPLILILDEATSALDNDTERVVMDAIEMLHGDMTLIIIAHRLTTIKKCDRIFECVNKGIVERKYDEFA